MPVTDRVLVFGGGGFVGGNLSTIGLRRGLEVHIADARLRDAIPGAKWHEVDITNDEQVERLVQVVRPNSVVDVAAISQIDFAEQNRELTYAVNVKAAERIAVASLNIGAHFLYFSSDAVFAGTKAGYTESDPPAPVNYYGRTKAEAEAAIRRAVPSATLVRISLALGFPVTDGNSFFASLYGKLQAGDTVDAPAEEIRTPLDVLTMSECVLELLKIKYQGPIHLGSTTSIDRASLTRRAAGLLGFPAADINEAPPTKPGRAPRHKKGIISVNRAQSVLNTTLPDAEGAITRAIEKRLDK